jgi:CheY-like chemotaxis protein
MLVLIADDDPDLCNVLALRCRALKLEVQIASNATDALRMMEERTPDLVILDVAMPNGSGLAVCEMMSHHEKLKQLPVVMLTGKKDSRTIQRCHEMCAYYVTKCDDVWGRLRPLVTSLLELNVDASSEDAGIEKDAAEPAVEPEHQIEPEDSEEPKVPSILDAVFAALGANNDAPEPSDDSATDPGKRPWVLCIDDDAEFSRILQLRLEEHGVGVTRAYAGREGVRTACTTQAQAIILDYQMPDGNGDYVLRRLKDNPLTRDIPVIVMTGLRDRHIERQVRDLGAAGFMTKPYDWPTLWSTLRQYMPEPMVGATR